MKTCMDINSKKVDIAQVQCPKGYHIEFSRRGYVLYVLDGYAYDIDDDLCYKIENSFNVGD